MVKASHKNKRSCLFPTRLQDSHAVQHAIIIIAPATSSPSL